MITESDMKALRTSASRRYRVIVLTAFPFAIATCLVGGVANFMLSARFAEMSGMTMHDVTNGMFASFPVSEQFPGGFVTAVQRFDLGLILFLAAALQAGMMTLALIYQKRNTRLLKFIEEKRS
jgi:hypothetical protein